MGVDPFHLIIQPTLTSRACGGRDANHKWCELHPSGKIISQLPRPPPTPSTDTPAKLAKRMSRRWRVILLRAKGEIDELVTAITAPRRALRQTFSYWVAEWPASLRVWRLKMHSAENTADRELTDAELNDVSGGGLAEIIIAVAIGMSGPNVGTIERQAAVLGMSHLL